MRIEELIEELEDVKEEHGNIEVQDSSKGKIKELWYREYSDGDICWIV